MKSASLLHTLYSLAKPNLRSQIRSLISATEFAVPQQLLDLAPMAGLAGCLVGRSLARPTGRRSTATERPGKPRVMECWVDICTPTGPSSCCQRALRVLRAQAICSTCLHRAPSELIPMNIGSATCPSLLFFVRCQHVCNYTDHSNIIRGVDSRVNEKSYREPTIRASHSKYATSRSLQ